MIVSRSRLAAHRRDELGEAGPLGFGDGTFVLDEARCEVGIAVNGNAVAACEADQLRGTRTATGGDAQWNRLTDGVPCDRDCRVITDDDDGGARDGARETAASKDRETLRTPARVRGGETIVFALFVARHGETGGELDVANEGVEDAKRDPGDRESSNERKERETGGARRVEERAELRRGCPEPRQRDTTDRDSAEQIEGCARDTARRKGWRTGERAARHPHRTGLREVNDDRRDGDGAEQRQRELEDCASHRGERQRGKPVD